VDGALKSLTLDSQFSILEVKVPEKMIEKTVEELALPDEWSVTIVTLLKERKRRSIWGVSKGYREVIGVVRPDTTLQASDRLVLFGKTQQIQDMLEAYEYHSED
jgi:trk system potassium uptake protein TrkA